jgi:NAD(P)-dependent dehydrogenase (short-subunit alcohol dehydrogenase family)
VGLHGRRRQARVLRATAAANPARRVGAPADIAGAVLFAIDDTFVTGTTLHVDGGGRLG